MVDLSSLNAFDYTVLLVLGISGVLATFRGAVREVLGLIGWGVAIIMARILQPSIAEAIEDIIGNETAVAMLAFALPFVITVILWFLFANVISPGLRNATFNTLDKPLGFIFGVMRGFVLVALVYIGGLLLYERESYFPDIVTESLLITPTSVIASKIVGFGSDDFSEGIRDSIPDRDIRDISKKLLPNPDEVIDDSQEAIGNTFDDARDLLPDEEYIY